MVQENVHPWLKKISICSILEGETPLLKHVIERLLDHFRVNGHTVLAQPDSRIDVIINTAPFGESINWRKSLMLIGRARFHLSHAPLIFTFIHATPKQLNTLLNHFQKALGKETTDPNDFHFPGLTENAYSTLYEQGKRGGPILSVIRLLQSQAKSIRIILIIGEDHPIEAYTFDLVGAHPRSDAKDEQFFYNDLMVRILTAASTHEITNHQTDQKSIPLELWQKISTPTAMRMAGRELGNRNFFTEMVSITNLVNIPAVQDAIATQYSEGCFATWDPELNALITTVTGSARPVNKDNITDDELAVITGVRPDGQGAIIRLVEGKRNDPPSSEAVELIAVDSSLPKIRFEENGEHSYEVPVIRSKLHGHRGIRSFDPKLVEHVDLDSTYYHYPVSCSTEAQATAIRSAFLRSYSLNNPNDPRSVVFTLIPGHGIVVVEKWVKGKAPFQVIWEYIDDGTLQIDNLIPQGPFKFIADPNLGMVIKTEEDLYPK